MEVITIDMITGAIYSLAGLGALITVLTQLFKKWFKTTEKWQNHLLAFVAAILCNAAVIAIGVTQKIGIYADFDVNSWMSWIMGIGTTILMAGMSNSWWSYEFMKKFLEWLKLMPKPEPEPEPTTEPRKKEIETGDGC